MKKYKLNNTHIINNLIFQKNVWIYDLDITIKKMLLDYIDREIQ